MHPDKAKLAKHNLCCIFNTQVQYFSCATKSISHLELNATLYCKCSFMNFIASSHSYEQIKNKVGFFQDSQELLFTSHEQSKDDLLSLRC